MDRALADGAREGRTELVRGAALREEKGIEARYRFGRPEPPRLS
jgi:hypothetical protein